MGIHELEALSDDSILPTDGPYTIEMEIKPSTITNGAVMTYGTFAFFLLYITVAILGSDYILVQFYLYVSMT